MKCAGGNKKSNAMYLLEKYMCVDIDYKTFAPEYSGAKNGKGGHNIKKYC
jgi:hypothetical protein